MILKSNHATGADLRETLGEYVPQKEIAFDGNGKRRHLLMLGGSTLQLPALRMAKEEEWAVILADGNPDVPGREFADYFEPIDLKDKDAMLEMARSYHASGKLHGVFTAATDFSTTVSWVAEALNLPGIPYTVALNASDKARMRRLFSSAEIPSPRFVEVVEGFDPGYIKSRLSLPVVIKPVDSMGARGVRRIDDWYGLADAIKEARKHSRSNKAIVEEFIEGKEYSIDSLVLDGGLVPCGIALRHIYFPPYFVELGHTLPSDLTPEQESELIRVFSRAVKCLGITSGAAKGDIFWGPAGPVVGEIAARLSGGYMSGWTFPYASGVAVTRAALRLAMGLPVPSLGWRHKMVSAERAIVSVPGRIVSVQGYHYALEIPHVRTVFLRSEPDDVVVFPTNNVEKAGNVIASGITQEVAVESAESAVSAIVIRLEPANRDTRAYLFRPWDSLPEAFPAHLRFFRSSLRDMLPPDSLTADSVNRLPWQTLFFEELTDRCRQDRDWTWMTFARAYEKLIEITGMKVNAGTPKDAAENPFDCLIWFALCRGGLQLAIWVWDTFSSSPDIRNSMHADFLNLVRQ